MKIGLRAFLAWCVFKACSYPLEEDATIDAMNFINIFINTDFELISTFFFKKIRL